MSGTARRASTGERFMPTLQGIRYLDHRKNPPEAVGTVVPWKQVRLMAANHAVSAIVLDQDGKPLGTRWRPVAWAVPLSQRPAVRWATKRAEAKMLAERTFDIREVDRERHGLVWLYRIVLAAMLLSIGIAAWVLWLAPNSPSTTMLVRNGAHAGMFLMCAANFGLMALLVSGRARVNVAAVRVSGEGIEAETIDGRRESVPWQDVRRVRRQQIGTLVLDSVTGVRLRFVPQRSAFVFRDWMERIGGEPTEAKRIRSILIRSAIWCQVGALIGAGLIYWLGGLSNQTPLGFYLSAGVLLPLFLVFATRFDGMTERVAKSFTRSRSQRRRSRAVSPPATSAAQ